ncbi:hypothetical protein RB195_016232 [Necator americanus]|uniref:Uncharacterized protein n=1 Tax=Necator americanus TaxID=51031 RepID=A0ABR1E864_NECAM
MRCVRSQSISRCPNISKRTRSLDCANAPYLQSFQLVYTLFSSNIYLNSTYSSASSSATIALLLFIAFHIKSAKIASQAIAHCTCYLHELSQRCQYVRE